jgi:hypothetical protein
VVALDQRTNDIPRCFGRITYVFLRLGDEKVSPLCTPFDLEKFFKFEYTTFATEVTLVERLASVVFLRLREIRHKRTTLLPSWKMGCHALRVSVWRGIQIKHAHRPRMIDTLCPWPISDPILVITHESHLASCPLAGGTRRDRGIQVIPIFGFLG